MSIKVFHGGIDKIDEPICKFGRPNLDFGQGFYVTDMRKQAVDWAWNVARREMAVPVLNSYMLDIDSIKRDFRCRFFTAYDAEWVNFIVASRTGKKPWLEYDFIEGGVTNDRVVDSIKLFIQGMIPFETTLARLSEHKPNNQICILNQDIIDNHLKFISYEYIH